MLARNVLDIHKFKLIFRLLDQGLIFIELVFFDLVFTSDLRGI